MTGTVKGRPAKRTAPPAPEGEGPESSAPQGLSETHPHITRLPTRGRNRSHTPTHPQAPQANHTPRTGASRPIAGLNPRDQREPCTPFPSIRDER